MQYMNAIINNQVIPLEIMSTPQARSVGMMGRESMSRGMLFPFGEIGEQSFHMKNCLLPLDIIFISGNKINSIHRNCAPCNENICKNYEGIGDKVLELPGGYCDHHNINPQDIIEFV